MGGSHAKSRGRVSKLKGRKKADPKQELVMQRLGNHWYVFGVFEGECFYTRIDEDAFQEPVEWKSLKNFG